MLPLLKKFRDWILCVGLLGVIGGAVCIYFLPVTRWRAIRLQQPPQQLTVAELAERRPGENPHVVVTDFVCGQGFAFQIKTRSDNKPVQEMTGSGQAWIPLFPKTEEILASPTDPPKFVVLLQTAPGIGSGTEFHLLSRRSNITGLIIPPMLSGLTSELRGKLQQYYPETKFDDCLILDEVGRGRREDTILYAQALLLGAIVGPLVGLPALILAIVLGKKKKGVANSTGEEQPPAVTG